MGRLARWIRLGEFGSPCIRATCEYSSSHTPSRLFLTIHKSTFCVNSLCHWLGDKPYDDKLTPKDCILTAVITMGEGYHNFHHEFPMDYRNGYKWYQYDPTKWFLWSCEKLGLATHLKVSYACWSYITILTHTFIEVLRQRSTERRVDCPT